MNQIASRLSEASLLMEGTAHPELAEMLRIGANEIERLQRVVDSLTPKPAPKPKEGHCQLCGEPMPPGEEVFRFHGYSGPCPTPERGGV